MSTRKAIVLLSGGMDSATTLAIARGEGFEAYALSFAYGQRHSAELEAAKSLAKTLDTKEHRILRLDLGQLGGSALTDSAIAVPTHRSAADIGHGVPLTYVPARNAVFLTHALAWAEVLKAYAIFIGVNALDYSGYPDCRPEFIRAFEDMANLATAYGVQGGERIRIHTPLIQLTKAEIIQRGVALGVDFSQTVTCYQADSQGRACGVCDACILRKKGFAEAGIPDSTRYIPDTL